MTTSTSGPTDRPGHDRVGGDAIIDTSAVLAWALPGLRDLPWRSTRDPWPILVAEVMLQQTQAPRVVPRWQAFLARYPRPTECAAAPLGDVLRLWQGLGYPRRARNLHRAAEVICRDHDGAVPDELGSLLALPGVGPYTARAVLAFAFERDVGVVDTNTARILARVGGRRLGPSEAQRLADEQVPPGDGWLWNQALIDIGARCCRPTPTCGRCPLAPSCRWHVAGHPAPDPARGSAGVSTSQPAYEGSARQARGRILAALTAGEPVERPIGDPIVQGLLADGLVVIGDAGLTLPG
jgi:A/G-specific adenine glycosylase